MRASAAVLFRAPAIRIAGRIAAPAPAPAIVALSTLWVGFALAPEMHPAWRVPAILVLATFAGASAELVAQSIGRGQESRAALGMLWPLAVGVVIALAEWLSSIGPRPWIATPLATLAVVAVICLQWGEVRGGTVVHAGAHTVNTGLGFALAFGAYAVALSMPVASGLLLLAIATFGVALVILRGSAAGPREVLLLAGVSALAVSELGLVFRGTALPSMAAAALLVTSLYAAAGTCGAMLERAAPRAYVEVAGVSLAVLAGVWTVAFRV